MTTWTQLGIHRKRESSYSPLQIIERSFLFSPSIPCTCVQPQPSPSLPGSPELKPS